MTEALARMAPCEIQPAPQGHKLKELWGLLLLLGFAFHSSAAPPPRSSDLFPQQQVLTIQITISAQASASLNKNPRDDVPAVVRDGRQTWSNVLVRLKGSTGSFRKVEDKPSLTLNFQAGNFHGLSKLHLNNSVEDPSYLNEYVGSELFRAGGVPAARAAHALLELNGRRLGLYVLVEGFTEEFLGGYFKNPKGNLYDTGPGHDVNEVLHLSLGSGSGGQPDLLALGTACFEADLGKRWVQLRRKLDTDRFLSFMAMEVLLNHRDGYCLAKNNFRVYHDLDTDKILFLPHGMDQLFGKPDASLVPGMGGLVAKSMMQIPEARQLYKERLHTIVTNVLRVAELQKAIQQKVALIGPVLSRQERRDFEKEAEALQGRIARRHQGIQQQFAEWEKEQPRFAQGRAGLTNWVPVVLGNKGKMNLAPGPPAMLHIQAEPGSAAAWKTRVLLPKGRYLFSAMVKTQAVAIKRVAKNPGARLRVPGHTSERSASLLATQPWTKLSVPFEVTEGEQSVELLCELSADAGEAFFRQDSILVEQDM